VGGRLHALGFHFQLVRHVRGQHEGRCVADEAPDLIPGMPYRYRGDPEFAAALVDEWKRL
jgi:hypothetical protein